MIGSFFGVEVEDAGCGAAGTGATGGLAGAAAAKTGAGATAAGTGFAAVATGTGTGAFATGSGAGVFVTGSETTASTLDTAVTGAAFDAGRLTARLALAGVSAGVGVRLAVIIISGFAAMQHNRESAPVQGVNAALQQKPGTG
ncbi:hypothetical protein [Sandarakinorhabdus sp.]|uniref:hypothetical protein n=1 Tax=Sandarakinorhabdus sp. TaxID=1916663 RepID=UPI003F717048